MSLMCMLFLKIPAAQIFFSYYGITFWLCENGLGNVVHFNLIFTQIPKCRSFWSTDFDKRKVVKEKKQIWLEVWGIGKGTLWRQEMNIQSVMTVILLPKTNCLQLEFHIGLVRGELWTQILIQSNGSIFLSTFWNRRFTNLSYHLFPFLSPLTSI